MLWEHEPQASVSTVFSSSPKLLRVFLKHDRNTENMFSISFRKHCTEKNEMNLLTLINKMWIMFARVIITLTACASSVFLSSYRNTILSQLHYNVCAKQTRRWREAHEQNRQGWSGRVSDD